MTDNAHDVARLLAHIRATIDPDPAEWERWPGGWVGDIEAALVDAVFSARAVYKPERGRGIHAQVVKWREARHRLEYSLDALLAEIDELGVEQWARNFGNRQRSPRRLESAPLGASKAAAVRQGASALREHGFNTALQINLGDVDYVKRALQSVPGIGYATANYFLMLLGAPGVKPDRMIRRFLREALCRDVKDREAETLIRAAAVPLDVQPHKVDHAIWRHESDRARWRDLTVEQINS